MNRRRVLGAGFGAMAAGLNHHEVAAVGALPMTTVSGDAELSASAEVYRADASAGPVAMTLPDAGTLPSGTVLEVVKVDTSGAEVAVRAATGSIDGHSALYMYRPRERMRLRNVGGVWRRDEHRRPRVVDPLDFGARLDGKGGEAAAITNHAAVSQAIAEALHLGQVDGTGAVVHIAEGNLRVSEPVVLPTNGSSPASALHIMGASRFSSIISGGPAFPAGRAIFQVEFVADRIWEMSIRQLRVSLPPVNGTMAFRHDKMGTGWTYDDIVSQWLQLDLENILVDADNSHHQRLFYFGIGNRFSTIRNVFGNPVLGTGRFHTYLFETAFDHGGDAPPIGADTVGFSGVHLDNVHAMVRAGGHGNLIKGRLNGSTLENAFANGGGDLPCFDLYNTHVTRFANVRTEGQGEKPQYRLTRMHHCTWQNFGIGNPNDTGDGVGNGMELIDCHHNRFDSRVAASGPPAFSTLGVKVLAIDAASSHNVAENFGLTVATPGAELDEVSIAGRNNHVSGQSTFGSAGSPSYAAYSLGSHPQRPSGAVTEDWGTIENQGTLTEEVTVLGAALGDFAEASLTAPLGGLDLTAYVSAPDTVTCVVRNLTGQPVSIGTATLAASARKR